ncbi:MAG: NAD-dependent epimerase [Azospirillum brasilense]|nr:MAG: NAD-dependent epimerase [Azospirillum brasilense]
MRVLITGNMGYVGPVLVRHLRQRFPQAELIGFDSGLFAHCLTTPDAMPEVLLDAQHFGDVRTFPAILLKGVDAVVHLSALSNDPMGKNFEAPTEAINYRASLKMAELARDAGVKHFVFASSCSVYGAASEGAKREGDGTDPLTAYARSKVGTEDGLRQFDAGDMTITCLRFATACGMSDRLRLDLVLNDFVACALTSGRITVLSDGSPWRPLIHVKDMARAIEWAATRKPENGGPFLVVNAGSEPWNYQVRDLAQEVAAQLPGTQVSINTDAPPDRRSYRVDFSLFRELAPQHQPQVTLDEAIAGLIEGLRRIEFNDPEFRSSPYIRLHTLSRHIDSGRLSPDIRWVRQ